MRTTPAMRRAVMLPLNGGLSGLAEKRLIAVNSVVFSDTASQIGDKNKSPAHTMLLDDDAGLHINNAQDPGSSIINFAQAAAQNMERARPAVNIVGFTSTAHAALDGYTPPGTGNVTGNQLIETLSASSNISKGQPITVLSSNSASLANAYLGILPITPTGLVIGLANESVSIGNDVDVVTSGVVSQSDWSAVTGTTNLTAGNIYFLDGPTAGKLTNAGMTTDGYMAIRVGRALDAQRMLVEITDGVIV